MPLVTASPPYVFDFGSVNAGQVPVWTVFKNEATGAALTPPAIVEDEQGLFEFSFNWQVSYPGVLAIRFKAVCNGLEISDVITSVPVPGTTSAVGATFSTLGLSTAGTIINRAALQLGLLAQTVANAPDPFASTDGNFLQLAEYLNAIGQDLAERYEWTQLIKECTITTAASGTSYALPADFHAMVDRSGWNRTSRLPLIGPLTGQETQYLKARLSGSLINIAMRIQGNLLIFPIAPPNSQTLVFEYLSDYWVQTAASQVGPDAKTVNAASDIVIHDADLVVMGLKLRWLEDRGFPTEQVMERYEARLEHRIGVNAGSRTLNIAGGGAGERRIDAQNIPLTGFGQ